MIEVRDSIRERYQRPADLPLRIPVFPLRGAILLPRATMPLNIFEPRYLAMVEHVLATHRIVGIVQPGPLQDETESPIGKSVPLRRIGGAGRLTAFSETEDGRNLITLTGVSRFMIEGEAPSDRPFRICDVSFEPYASDLIRGHGEETVDRERLIKVLKVYLEAKSLKADWEAIGRCTNEILVNMLSMISPYGPEEKQALLEAADLEERSKALIALAEMEIASRPDGSGSALQ
jgi:hypothetical protein